eukprot:TRINITY_DN11407_c0_g1_i1.p1 TRINITY_DN11407_c0_g1~~TRINITY_DN11407_c0_g1_i1.p1  ORF type:complete len:177 (+),score=25.76 TRINITY_DN11407_c0_g1_i1:39-569(+)
MPGRSVVPLSRRKLDFVMILLFVYYVAISLSFEPVMAFQSPFTAEAAQSSNAIYRFMYQELQELDPLVIASPLWLRMAALNQMLCLPLMLYGIYAFWTGNESSRLLLFGWAFYDVLVHTLVFAEELFGATPSQLPLKWILSNALHPLGGLYCLIRLYPQHPFTQIRFTPIQKTNLD